MTSSRRSYPQADNRQFRITRGYGPHHIPLPAYWEEVSCESVGCLNFIQGWVTRIPAPSTTVDLRERQRHQVLYNYIRNDSGRSFEEKWEDGLIKFLFPPGQQCFSTHRRPVERDPIFLVGKKSVDFDEFFYEFNETTDLLERRRRNG